MKRLVWAATVLVALSVGYGSWVLTASLPQNTDEKRLPGLSHATSVNFDTFAVPAIEASTRTDAFRVLGFLHARDRLFQMELMRRKSAGRLAELFGSTAVALDRQQRGYLFSKTARAIVNNLPADQRDVLQAYVAGVNAYLEQASLPPEFLALRHTPEPWHEEDTILVILGMFQTLNGQEQDERMVSVMEKALPADLLEFLTPDTDSFAMPLVGGEKPRRFSDQISPNTFAALPEPHQPLALASVDMEHVVAGSNNWVVSGQKTTDGRAIIANDMHLPLSVPNVWYRAELRYGQHHLYGVSLPGVPAIVVGGNDHVAWGFTNATADLLDLIRLEIKPDDPNQYRTPDGWRPFSEHLETIKVKNAPDVVFQMRETVWGPVSEQPLLGQPVAVKWLALTPGAVDLGLLAMEDAQSTEQAMALMNRIGAPPQNVVIADREGHIGWTYMGRFPRRIGFDGLVSRSWADGQIGWQGFLLPEELPRLLDPADGFIVTANNRTLGKDYPHVLGHNWALSYRAFRIAERLRAKNTLAEADLLAIQLDTRGGVYDFYQQLALDALAGISAKDHQLQDIERVLRAWDGYMHSGSLGAAFLNEFRQQLASAVFAKVVTAGQQYDPQFRYAWREMETPLRLLLQQRPAGVLAADYRDDWRQLIMRTLRTTTDQLQRRYPERAWSELTWGETQPIVLQHPFSKPMPWLASWLDMSAFASDGCASVCVKVLGSGHGASERLVLSPAHPEAAIFQMPGGQSGHPLSRHYRDQQSFWQQGIALPLKTTEVSATLTLLPVAQQP